MRRPCQPVEMDRGTDQRRPVECGSAHRFEGKAAVPARRGTPRARRDDSSADALRPRQPAASAAPLPDVEHAVGRRCRFGRRGVRQAGRLFDAGALRNFRGRRIAQAQLRCAPVVRRQGRPRQPAPAALSHRSHRPASRPAPRDALCGRRCQPVVDGDRRPVGTGSRRGADQSPGRTPRRVRQDRFPRRPTRRMGRRTLSQWSVAGLYQPQWRRPL